MKKNINFILFIGMEKKIQKNTYDYQKKRGLKRKVYLIDLKGGKCEKCGYDHNVSAFDFHHRNPEEKEFQLDARHLSNLTMKKILVEFEKCDVVCANCHREIHYPELEINNARNLIGKSDLEKVIRVINKPKCTDCGIEVNYTSKRCVSCESKRKRKVERPNLELLAEEKSEKGTSWCAKKYGVSSKTIRRWLKDQFQ